jgi:lysophospholipase L1-like esterase
LLASLPVASEDIVMLGDSITEAGVWEEFFPDLRIINRGVGLDTTAGALRRVSGYVTAQPRMLVIMLGTNDLLRGVSISTTRGNYQKIVDTVRKLSPGTRIVIQSIPPCGQVSSVMVSRLNEELRALAQESGASFLDTHVVLTDTGGHARREMLQEDGIHLTSEGYRAWIELLRPHVETCK